jgi:hypothetical protein
VILRYWDKVNIVVVVNIIIIIIIIIIMQLIVTLNSPLVLSDEVYCGDTPAS